MNLSPLARTLRADLVALIADVSTPDELAAKLSNLGHAGHPYRACSCPVAAYLLATGHYAVIQVSREDIWASDDDGDTVAMEPPVLVSCFIRAYDRDRWPELIMDDATVTGHPVLV